MVAVTQHVFVGGVVGKGVDDQRRVDVAVDGVGPVDFRRGVEGVGDAVGGVKVPRMLGGVKEGGHASPDDKKAFRKRGHDERQ